MARGLLPFLGSSQVLAVCIGGTPHPLLLAKGNLSQADSNGKQVRVHNVAVTHTYAGIRCIACIA
jgi:hypothetical protein